MCEEAGIPPREVYEVVVCGNVTMMQLALGIDPEPLGMAPFIITARRLPPARAADFGLHVHPLAPAFVFPSLGAYVGGDIVWGCWPQASPVTSGCACSSTSAPTRRSRWGSFERLVSTAAPAGPAFEAAQIRCGMRAAEGAIEGVAINATSSHWR